MSSRHAKWAGALLALFRPPASRSAVVTKSGISKEILYLAIPAALQNLLQTAMFVVDTKMIANYAHSLPAGQQEAPLAALAVIGPICWSLTVITTITAVGATALVGRRFGENNIELAKQITSSAIWIALVISSVVAVFGYFYCDSLVAALLSLSDKGDRHYLQSAASAYLGWFLLLFPIRAVVFTLEGALRGAGDTTTPMWGGLFANLVNVVVNSILIFGLLGAPRMGVAGAGLGVALAAAGELFLVLWLMRRKGSRLSLRFRDFLIFSTQQAKAILKISLPALLDGVIFHSGFLIYQLAIFSLEEVDIAAHRVAITLQSAAFMPAAGFYAAAASLSGRILGAGNKELATLAATRTLRLGLLSMLPIIAVFLLAAEPLAMFFSDGNQQLVPLAALCLFIGAFEIPFLLCTESLRGTLIGAGETRWPMLVTVVGTWGVRVPCSWLLAVHWEMGLAGIWYTTVADWILRAAVIYYLFRKGGWRERVL